MIWSVMGLTYPADWGPPHSQGGCPQCRTCHWHRQLEVPIHTSHLRKDIKQDVIHDIIDLP